MPSFLRKEEGTGRSLFWCARCAAYFPATSFAPSSLRRRVARCSKCRVQQVKEQRERSPVSIAAYCLYEMERRSFGHRGGFFSQDLVRRILERSGWRSALSGRTDRLRLRRFWSDLPFSERNAVVVTATENRALGHCKDPIARFPPVLVAAMRTVREADEGKV